MSDTESRREIVLVGGPGDGIRTMWPDAQPIRWVTYPSSIALEEPPYRYERYYLDTDVPGAYLFRRIHGVTEQTYTDLSRAETVTWLAARVWAQDWRHKEIRESFGPLNNILAAWKRARVWGDDIAASYAADYAVERMRETVALMTPGGRYEGS